MAELPETVTVNLKFSTMNTTAKVANALGKFAGHTVCFVGIPLVLFSGVEFLVSELQRDMAFEACLESKALDDRAAMMEVKFCRR